MASSTNRRYSEEEIRAIFRRAIFRRATERQDATGAADPHHGLTLDELKSIGAESGIDPAHVEAAAVDIERGTVESPPLSLLERFYGLSASIRVERVLPGSMVDATWDDAVEVLRSIFNTRGQDETIGPIREWSAFTSSGFDYQALFEDDTWYNMLEGLNLTQNATRSPVHVEIKPEADDTRITATYQMPSSRLWEAPSLFGIFVLSALITSTVFLLVDMAIVFLLIPLGLLLFGGGLAAYQRQTHRNEIRTTRKRIDKAMERITYLQAAKTSSAPEARSAKAASSESADTPSLEWEEESEASSSTGSPSRRRERS